MLVTWMADLGLYILDIIFAITGVLPNFSTDVTNTVDQVFDLMFSAVSLVAVFVDMNMVKILIPFVILIINFDKIIKVVMFVLKKIPMINIK